MSERRDERREGSGTMPKLRKNDANYCRLKGWTVGTIVVLDVDAYAGQVFQDRFRITAIGEAAILVRQVYQTHESCEIVWKRTLVNRAVLESVNP